MAKQSLITALLVAAAAFVGFAGTQIFIANSNPLSGSYAVSKPGVATSEKSPAIQPNDPPGSLNNPRVVSSRTADKQPSTEKVAELLPRLRKASNQRREKDGLGAMLSDKEIDELAKALQKADGDALHRQALTNPKKRKARIRELERCIEEATYQTRAYEQRLQQANERIIEYHESRKSDQGLLDYLNKRRELYNDAFQTFMALRTSAAEELEELRELEDHKP